MGKTPKYCSFIRREIAVHASKHPNVFRRPYGTLVEDEGSQTIPMLGLRNINNIDYKIMVEILNI